LVKIRVRRGERKLDSRASTATAKNEFVGTTIRAPRGCLAKRKLGNYSIMTN
jgi:hypothetical protein